MVRISAIFNYIPRRSRNLKNFNIWYSCYKNVLIHIFKMLKNDFQDKYSSSVRWNNVLFTNFCRFVHARSTRHIPEDFIEY